MNCQEIQNELVAYLDGELGPGERDPVEEHLRYCAGCRAKLAALQNAVQAILSLPATGPSPGFEQRFAKTFEEVRAGSWQSFREGLVRWWRPLAIGAGVAASLLAVFLWIRPAEIPAGSVEAEIARNLDLYRDYEVIKNLDVLEDLEVIEALDEEG